MTEALINRIVDVVLHDGAPARLVTTAAIARLATGGLDRLRLDDGSN